MRRSRVSRPGKWRTVILREKRHTPLFDWLALMGESASDELVIQFGAGLRMIVSGKRNPRPVIPLVELGGFAHLAGRCESTQLVDHRLRALVREHAVAVRLGLTPLGVQVSDGDH